MTYIEEPSIAFWWFLFGYGVGMTVAIIAIGFILRLWSKRVKDGA